jgi:hypothetical protein
VLPVLLKTSTHCAEPKNGVVSNIRMVAHTEGAPPSEIEQNKVTDGFTTYVMTGNLKNTEKYLTNHFFIC